MMVDLTETTAAVVATTLAKARWAIGGPTTGLVLTLVIMADEASTYDAVRAAAEAGREHPCRVLSVVARPGRGDARLDAEVRVGGEAGTPGETVILRLHGPLAQHPESVVLPLLVPDAPVVVWWPGSGPAIPGKDPCGALAVRRITDAAAAARPMKALAARQAGYLVGDTDLSWTRLTTWRTALAAALDEPYDPIIGIEVHAARGNPSAELLTLWLEQRLEVPAERVLSKGPGITMVVLRSANGDITLSRPDGRVAKLTRPGSPERTVALPRRSTAELLAEELRRLDPDEVFASVIASLGAAAAHDNTKGESTHPDDDFDDPEGPVGDNG